MSLRRDVLNFECADSAQSWPPECCRVPGTREPAVPRRASGHSTHDVTSHDDMRQDARHELTIR